MNLVNHKRARSGESSRNEERVSPELISSGELMDSLENIREGRWDTIMELEGAIERFAYLRDKSVRLGLKRKKHNEKTGEVEKVVRFSGGYLRHYFCSCCVDEYGNVMDELDCSFYVRAVLGNRRKDGSEKKWKIALDKSNFDHNSDCISTKALRTLGGIVAVCGEEAFDEALQNPKIRSKEALQHVVISTKRNLLKKTKIYKSDESVREANNENARIRRTFLRAKSAVKKLQENGEHSDSNDIENVARK